MTNFMNVLDPVASLGNQGDINCDSWYFFGRVFDKRGDEYDYLLHNTKVDGGKGNMQFVWQQVAITNITKGTRVFDHKVLPMDQLTAAFDKLEVIMPESSMTGDMKEMHVTANTKSCGFDLTLNPKGPVLYYNSGVFPWIQGTPNYEYAFPKIETKGTLVIDGEEVEVTGTSFFDRQWCDLPPVVMTNDFRWSWFAINIDELDYTITVWDVNWKEGDKEVHQGFATVLSPEGALTNAEILPLADKASDVWVSPDSGRRYNNKWVIEIPSLDTELHVQTTKHGHEMLNSLACSRPDGGKVPLNGLEHNLQTPATVKGKFMGEAVIGICHMELVGGW